MSVESVGVVIVLLGSVGSVLRSDVVYGCDGVLNICVIGLFLIMWFCCIMRIWLVM